MRARGGMVGARALVGVIAFAFAPRGIADADDATSTSTSTEVDPPAYAPFVAGGIGARAALEVGLPIDATHAATSVALDAFYDLNERFALGVTTSNDARRELGAGRGLCLSGVDGDACDPRFAGAAIDARVWLGPSLIGRAAIDTARFAPTVAALELGTDVASDRGRWRVIVSPTLRLGVARRDLSNGDTGAALAQIGLRAWPGGGLLAYARVEFALANLDDTPSLGLAGGAWMALGPFTLTARAGTAEVARTSPGPSAFAEIALAWSR